jgi:hypothetical protein
VTTLLDHSVGFGTEATFNLDVAPTRHFEWLEGSGLDYDANPNQGEGLRQGSKFPLADRRSVGIGRGDGKIKMELATKGMGLPFSYAFGTSVSTNVSGALYQQLHTATTSSVSLPSFTCQEGIVDASGNNAALTFGGCSVKSVEIVQPPAGIATVEFDIDTRSLHVNRTFVDGATTSGSAVLTSAAGAVFTLNDVGRSITGTGIPALTTVLSWQSATQITLSANASATGTGVSVTIGLAYTTPTYPGATAALYTSALPSVGALKLGGALTVPTTTALASSTGTIAPGLKGWTLNLDNGLDLKRDTVGDRRQPVTGPRKGTLTLVIEYDATTGATLREAQANQTGLAVLIEAGAIETIGTQTANSQLAIAVAKIDKGAIPMPSNGDVIVTEITLTVLDGLSAAQAVYWLQRTADIAL